MKSYLNGVNPIPYVPSQPVFEGPMKGRRWRDYRPDVVQWSAERRRRIG